jgi:hypothetical protein
MLTFAPVNLLFIKNIVIMKTKILLFAVMLFGALASANAWEVYNYTYGDTRYEFVYAGGDWVDTKEYSLDGTWRSTTTTSVARADAKRAELEALIAEEQAEIARKEEWEKNMEEWWALVYRNLEALFGK